MHPGWPTPVLWDFATLGYMALGTARPNKEEMGKHFFKGCKINKKSTLAWGNPTKPEPATGLLGVTLLPRTGHRPQGSDASSCRPTLVDVGGWDSAQWVGQAMAGNVRFT